MNPSSRSPARCGRASSLLRAQASLEALGVLLILLVLLQTLSLSLQVFGPNQRLVYVESSERQALAAQALVQSEVITDLSVRLPSTWYPSALAQSGYLVSARNASINVSVLSPALGVGEPT